MEEFFNDTKLCFGSKALGYLKQYQSFRCFIVADPFLVESGMIGRVTEYLSEYEVFGEVVPDPPLDLIVQGIQKMNQYDPKVLIAVGGGSAIDAAKAIWYFGMHLAKERSKWEEIPFLAVPTTSGTGSEVTSFAVITDADKGVKYPLVDKRMRPNVAILDPDLVQSVPPVVTADTGMDVLTHGLEAYVSTKATPFSDALAEGAIAAVFRYLPASFGDGDPVWKQQARTQMHYASCMAGMAFDAASLGLNHAIAHNIGGKFHVPHGRANGILLPYVVGFNAAISDYTQKDFSMAARKYAALAERLGFGGTSIRASVKNLIQQIKKLQRRLGMPVNFRDCGVRPEEYHKAMEDLILGAQKDSCIQTNPRDAAASEIGHILKLAL